MGKILSAHFEELEQIVFSDFQELGTVLARVGERMTEKELLAMVAEVSFFFVFLNFLFFCMFAFLVFLSLKNIIRLMMTTVVQLTSMSSSV